MNTTQTQLARKRTVNLSLNKDLVAQARKLTDDLSGVVESLLADYVEHERRQQFAKTRVAEATAAMWNDFNGRHGSFADNYSPL
jgi:antitoxin CcdA